MLLCYDYQNGIRNEEEDIIFVTKLKLFSIGTINLPKNFQYVEPTKFTHILFGLGKLFSLGENSLMCTKFLSQGHHFMSFLPSPILPCKNTFMDDYDGI
jgi:hypothetical protein